VSLEETGGAAPPALKCARPVAVHSMRRGIDRDRLAGAGRFCGRNQHVVVTRGDARRQAPHTGRGRARVEQAGTHTGQREPAKRMGRAREREGTRPEGRRGPVSPRAAPRARQLAAAASLRRAGPRHGHTQWPSRLGRQRRHPHGAGPRNGTGQFASRHRGRPAPGPRLTPRIKPSSPRGRPRRETRGRRRALGLDSTEHDGEGARLRCSPHPSGRRAGRARGGGHPGRLSPGIRLRRRLLGLPGTLRKARYRP
jgi:hypothetical protein